MDYLASAIIGIVSLLRELVTLLGGGQGDVSANVVAQAQAHMGDNLSFIFADGVKFISALAAEIMHQMGNTTP